MLPVGMSLTPGIISNASLTNRSSRGGTAACRSRVQVRTTLASSSASHHTKAFNMPNVLADYASIDGQTHFVGVKSTRLAVIQVKASPKLP